ncbi:MAG: DUF1566 domain-containing protein [Pseudomonadota bacterium]|nr:DUF1566 domain-containing protein [Pseudomonadota bacterium]
MKVAGPLLLCLLLVACGRPELKEFHPTSVGGQYVKLDGRGQPMGPREGPWACVRDTSSGLTWAVKSDDERRHHYSSTYRWSGDGTQDQGFSHLRGGPQGSCGDAAEGGCTTADYIRLTNREGLCGFQDWRLPSLTELRTLLAHYRPEPEPQVCQCFFPRTRRGGYWSADWDPATGQARALNFASGEARAYPLASYFYVRLVRGPGGSP